jgi:hypothetical protein
MTPLDKDFYEGIFNMKRKDKKIIEHTPNPREQSGKLLNTYQELLNTAISSYTYSAEPKEITFPAYKSARGDGKTMGSLGEILDLNNAMFNTYLEKRIPSIKEDYVLEIVKCFTKAFEEVYSNECPLELVNLCKEYVGNFVKSLDGSTKM